MIPRGHTGALLLRVALIALTLHTPAAPQVIAPADTLAIPIDFSHAGLGGGGVPVPTVPAVVSVRPTGGDDTALLQAALDHVATLPVGTNGFRGAVQLVPGRFRVGGQLQLRDSGVVLRGTGSKRTTLVATGQGRRALILVGGQEPPIPGTALRVTDTTVPAGSRTLAVEGISGLKVGDRVVVTRPSTAEWISALGMDTLGGAFADRRVRWTPGSRDLVWDRTVTAVDSRSRQITLDAPITTALERQYGGGMVAPVVGYQPVRHVGVEGLILESQFDASRPADEEHAWIGIMLDHVEDAWVRDVTARHFVGSAVRVGPRARRITIADVRSAKPVSDLGGYRRQSFVVEGQQVLVRRCQAEAGLNDFAVGLLAAGPNVFLDCTARGALGASGSFESWASGALYERVRVEGAGLQLSYDVERAQGGGWTAANSVVWNSTAKEIEARGPEGAPNRVYTSPEPLYERQLARRVGAAAARTALAPAPTPRVPAPGVREFRVSDIPSQSAAEAREYPPLQIVNGRFVIGGRTVWGGIVNEAWWRGQAVPASALDHGVSTTRFVPGRIGPGLTEDLEKLAARMTAAGTPFYQTVPGLWYDRRRDDHTVVRRSDANVWAPFYEMPWARSGRGRAWDRLSQYDLTRYNPWYFERTREFAQIAEQYGLVLSHYLYNTHNLLETAAHWVDFPWRPSNNINKTGLPDPPLKQGDDIHVANEFFSIENPELRRLHRAYILHTLDQLGSADNLLLGLAFQYAGPLAFQQFFLDTVREWEQRTGKTVRVVLTTGKGITDSILADPVRARQIAVIDTRYWQYRPDGSLWVPRAGENLAFREMILRDFGISGDAPPPTTPEQSYRQVREYRDRFPDKAIIAFPTGPGPIPSLIAGAAQVQLRNPNAGQGQGRTADRTHLDAFVREHLATTLMNMAPRDGVAEAAGPTWVLADAPLGTVLVYSLAGPAITLARSLPGGEYQGVWFDQRTGGTRLLAAPERWQQGTTIHKPTGEDWLLLLKARRVHTEPQTTINP